MITAATLFEEYKYLEKAIRQRRTTRTQFDKPIVKTTKISNVSSNVNKTKNYQEHTTVIAINNRIELEKQIKGLLEEKAALDKALQVIKDSDALNYDLLVQHFYFNEPVYRLSKMYDLSQSTVRSRIRQSGRRFTILADYHKKAIKYRF